MRHRKFGSVELGNVRLTLSSLIIQTLKEVADKRRDLVGRFVEGEMSRFQDMDFCRQCRVRR